MKRFVALLICAGVGLVSFAHGKVAAPRENDTHKIVYLSDAGPVVIELGLRIDGKSCRTAYRDFLGQVFDYLDRDRDGVLSKAEAASAPAASVLGGPSTFFGVRGTIGGPAPRIDANGDGKVTREELAAHYEKAGLKPFSITHGPRQTGVISLNGLGNREGSASAEAINKRLFELLDADKDGKLSRKELAAAPGILSKLDDNEDEVLTTAEVQGESMPAGDYTQAVLAFDAAGQRVTPTTSYFVTVGDEGSDPALAKSLLAQYAKKGETTVTREQLGVPQPVFDQLDKDGDGKLDASELARFGQVSPEARFTIRLGKREDKQPIVETEKANAAIRAEAKDIGVELTLGNVRILLRGPEPAPELNFNFNARDQYVTQFRTADTDGNGYLDKAEAEKSPFFRASFAQMDRDADGQLFEKEMLAYVDQLETLRKVANKSCSTLTVADAGKGLFEMIDRDGDGRLSVRELRQMASLLDTLDADKDDCLVRTEIPRRYKGTFDVGTAVGAGGAARAIVFRAGMEAPAQAPTKAKGPTWFRKMDRNRDGDVSRKEWLGTEEEFKAVDTDGDGLISLLEAEQFDKAKRRTN